MDPKLVSLDKLKDTIMGWGMTWFFIAALFLSVWVIYIAVIDPISFLTVLTTMSLAGFGFFKLRDPIRAVRLNNHPAVKGSRGRAKLAYKEARRELEKLLGAGPQPQQRYEDYLDSIGNCLAQDGCGNLLQYLPDDLKTNRELVESAIRFPDLEGREISENNAPSAQPVHSPLRHAAIALRKDRSLVLEAISSCADAYESASEDLKADPEIYLAALESAIFQAVDLHRPDNFILPEEWTPPFDSTFYEDSLSLAKFLGEFYSSLSYCGEHDSTLALLKYHFGKHFPKMFSDWSTVCYVLVEDYYWGWCEPTDGHPHEVLECLPDSLSEWIDADNDCGGGLVITSREFILFAINEGYPGVLLHASDALQNDEEIKRLVSESTKGSESS